MDTNQNETHPSFFPGLLSFGFATAHAGKPITGTVIESDHLFPWESQRVNATEWTESGDATQAFNWLQDRLGNPILMRCGTISIPTFSTGEVRLPAIGWR